MVTGERAVEKIKLRALLVRYWISSAEPHTKPPSLPTALLRVPISTSTLPSMW